MGKNKKKKGKSRPSQTRATAWELNLPESSDPESLIIWWTARVTDGFSPLGAEENLAQCRRHVSSPEQKNTLEALHLLISAPLSAPHPLVDAPAVPLAALVDEAGGRIFISGADGSGLSCLEIDSGRKIWHADSGLFRRITGMALSGATLFVCDRWTKRLTALSTDDGSEIWSTEEAVYGEKLAEPSDMALIEKGSRSEIWVCDREKHRIFSYSPDGTPLGRIGWRGMLTEETIKRFTKPASEPDLIHFEFPQSLSVETDIDGKSTVFVWDSWNRRVLCLDTESKLKRQVLLDRIKDSNRRFAGQVKVLSGPCGPVIMEIDDCRTALIVWGPEGELLLNLELKEALFGPSKKCELLRLASRVKSGKSDYLVTSGGKLFELGKGLLNTRELLDSLAALRPDNPTLALARCETTVSCRDESPALPRTWEDISANIAPARFVNQLLNVEDTLTGRLERFVSRLDHLVEDLVRTGADKSARELSEAVGQRLTELTREALEKLTGFTELNPKEENAWIEALTDLDMALFQNNGKNSWEEINLDNILERIRDYPDDIRRTAWKFRILNRLCSPRLSSGENEANVLRLARMAEKLLSKRRDILNKLGRDLTFKEKPQRIIRNEIKILHRSILNLKAVEQVAGCLAGEISHWLEKNADCSIEELPVLLFRCSKAASGLAPWDELYRKAAKTRAPVNGGTDFEIAESESEKSGRNRFEELRSLVENMEAYLKTVAETLNLSAHFSKVVNRQKEIFAIKASVLANHLAENGRQSTRAADLLERAGRIAGEAWRGVENLRISSEKGVVRA